MKLTTIKVYKAADGWRWRMRTPSGRIVACSAGAYVRKTSCFTAACRMVDTVAVDGVKVV